MEFNRATTLAKVLLRDRALEARDRKDKSLRDMRLFDHDAYPGSTKFSQALAVHVDYMSDLAEAGVSSIKDAHERTGIPLSGEAVERAVASLSSSFDTFIAARVTAWQGVLSLLDVRTHGMNNGNKAALEEAHRELKRQAAKLIERADAKLDVLLQSDLAAAERRSRTAEREKRSNVNSEIQPIPIWFPKAGLVSAAVAFLFLVVLIALAMRGNDVPLSARVLVNIALSLAVACAFTFFGGTAQAQGKIPFFKGQEPIQFATTGGIAVFIVVLGILVWLYH